MLVSEIATFDLDSSTEVTCNQYKQGPHNMGPTTSNNDRM